MITPAYSPTATERVLPRLALDFTTGVLDPRVTVTRALNTATRVNSSGYIETVNADLPRFDYNPVTLAPRGLLIEETRANLLTYSNQFEDPSWTLINLSVTNNAALSPDGTQNADKLISNTGAGYIIFKNAAVTAGTTYTVSVYLKAGEVGFAFIVLANSAFTTAGISVNLSTGAVSTATGTPLNAQSTNAGNGWWRVSFSLAAGVTTNGSVNIYLSNDGIWANRAGAITLNNGLYVYGAQIEAGSFATSYIPTTTTSLTRSRDTVSMTGTNFSSWYNASEGAIFAQGSTFDNVNFPALVTFGRADFSSNYMSILHLPSSSTVYSEGYVSGAIQFALSTTGNAKPAVNRAVMAYKANSFAASTNAGNVQTDNAGNIPTVDQLKIGRLNGDNNFLNGHMQKILYWPQRVINAETQAFSK